MHSAVQTWRPRARQWRLLVLALVVYAVVCVGIFGARSSGADTWIPFAIATLVLVTAISAQLATSQYVRIDYDGANRFEFVGWRANRTRADRSALALLTPEMDLTGLLIGPNVRLRLTPDKLVRLGVASWRLNDPDVVRSLQRAIHEFSTSA